MNHVAEGASAWPSIDPGQLRHQITFLSQQIGTDATGSNFTWVPAVPPVTTRAKIESIGARDMIQGGQTVSQVVMLVTIRWQDGVLPNSRFMTEQGSLFIIQAIRNIEDRNVLLELECVGFGDNE